MEPLSKLAPLTAVLTLDWESCVHLSVHAVVLCWAVRGVCILALICCGDSCLYRSISYGRFLWCHHQSLLLSFTSVFFFLYLFWYQSFHQSANDTFHGGVWSSTMLSVPPKHFLSSLAWGTFSSVFPGGHLFDVTQMFLVPLVSVRILWSWTSGGDLQASLGVSWHLWHVFPSVSSLLFHLVIWWLVGRTCWWLSSEHFCDLLEMTVAFILVPHPGAQNELFF